MAQDHGSLFAILSDGVHRFEGTIKQFTGDGIMALFSAPIAHKDHAQRACRVRAGGNPVGRAQLHGSRRSCESVLAATVAAVNIPGILTAVADRGSRIYTTDYQWTQAGVTNPFDTLSVVGDTAYLDQALDIPIRSRASRSRAQYAYFTAQKWYWARNPNDPPSVPTTTLRTIDLSAAARGSMREVSGRALPGYSATGGADSVVASISWTPRSRPSRAPNG